MRDPLSPSFGCAEACPPTSAPGKPDSRTLGLGTPVAWPGEAWQLGLKGITVYRYGSREGHVLTLGAGEEAVARDLFAKCDPGACRL